MKRGRRSWLWTLLVAGLLGGCATQRQPILIVPPSAPGADPALRVTELAPGDELHRRLLNGERGIGKLLSVEADTLVLVERPSYHASSWKQGPTTPADARRPRRIARADLVELSRWDRQAEPYIGAAIGLPFMAFALLLVVFTLDPPTIPQGF